MVHTSNRMVRSCRYAALRSILAILITCVTAVYSEVSTYSISLDSASIMSALPAAILKGAEEAYTINMKGLDALERGELDIALEHFKNASLLLPIYSDAENNKGVVYFRKGNVSIAKMIWEDVVIKDTSYAVAWYNLGVCYVHEHAYDTAVVRFKHALQLYPQFVDAMVMLGRSLLGSNQPREACTALKAAYALSPKRDDVWQYYAYARIMAGDTAGAKTILHAWPTHPDALRMLGQLEASRGNDTIAYHLFAQAVEAGASPSLFADLAGVQMLQQHYSGVLRTIKAYAKLVPEMPADMYCNAGIAEKETGSLNRALDYFEKGFAKYPDNALLRYNLGQLYFYYHRYTDAQRVWANMTDTLQKDPTLAYMQAISARQNNDLTSAEMYIRFAIKLGNKAEYHDFLGQLLYMQGRKDDAAASFKTALTINPQLMSAQLHRALLSDSHKEQDTAVAALTRQLKACKHLCSDIALRLAAILYKQGNVGHAADILSAIPDDDQTLDVMRYAAFCFRELGEWGKSAVLFERAKQRFVLDPVFEYTWAQDYIMAGDYTKAIEAFVDVLGRYTDNPWQIYYQIGYSYMQLNDRVKAEKYFLQSISYKEDNPPARGYLAFIYAQKGDLEKAQSLWQQNINDDAKNPVLYTNMALSLEQDKKYSEALDYYAKARELTPNDPGLLINIGNVYVALDNSTAAYTAYAGALHSPLREKAAYDIFALAQKKSDTVRARDMLTLLTTEFKTAVLTKRAWADASIRAGDTLKARQLYESIPDTAKDTEDWFALARIYIGYSEFGKAEVCIKHLPDEPQWQRAAIELAARKAYNDKNYSQAFRLFSSLHDTSFAMQYNLALIAFAANNYTDVLPLCDSLLSRTNSLNRIDVYQLAANAAIAGKQWDAALRWSSDLAVMKPNDAVIIYNCAVASYNLDFMSSAWTYYQQAKALNPALRNKDIENRHASLESPAQKITAVADDSLDIWYNDAVTQQEQQNDSAAEITYKRILERNPAYLSAQNNLGAIYSARGQLEEAIACFLAVLNKRHDMPEVYANLINIYLAQDNIAEAKRWIIKGLGHNPDSKVLKELETKVKDAQQTNNMLHKDSATGKHRSKQVR